MKKFLAMVLCAMMTIVMGTLPFPAEAGFGDDDTLVYEHLEYTVSEGKVTITGCNRSSHDITIPSAINYYPVVSIGQKAFYESYVSHITIPDSVTSIGAYAFGKSQLESITIPDSVTSIGVSAFSGCSALTEVTLPNGLDEIRPGVFSRTSLTSITIPNGVTAIGSEAFLYTRLTNINIPNSVTTIGDRAFLGCKFTTIDIPSNVTSIGNEAFSECAALKFITLPKTLTKIGADAFKGTEFYNKQANWEDMMLYIGPYLIGTHIKEPTDCCVVKEGTILIGDGAFYVSEWNPYHSNVKSIILPNGLKYIGDQAFYCLTNLRSVELPNGLIRIGDSAFRNCQKLLDITIPNSVKSIGSRAFEGCDMLDSVHYYGTREQWNAISSADDGLRNKRVIFEKPVGDVDGSSTVNMKDVLHLRKYLAGIRTAEFDSSAADVNNDGAINMKDVLQLRKILAGI